MHQQRGMLLMAKMPLLENRILPSRTIVAIAVFLAGAPAPGAFAGIAMDCEGSVKALALQGYQCFCSGGQLLCNGSGSGKAHKGASSAAGMKAMIAGAVFESLLTSLFAPPPSSARDTLAEQQKAATLAAHYLAQKKAKEAEEQAAFERMMKSFKQLEDASDTKFKTLSDSNLQFKTLDSGLEALAAGARRPLDTPAESDMPPVETSGGATPFFGDTMPTEDLQLLVNPENDPRVVDLRKANSYIIDNLKKDAEKTAAAAKGKENPAAQPVDCQKLSKKLNGYLDQRNKFHKTVLLAQEQLTTWQDANRNALVNGVKDGVEYFAGLYLEILKNRGEAADRLMDIYGRKSAEMARNGLDIREIEAKIARLKAMSRVEKFADVAATANDWQTFIKDGMSTLINQLTASNREIKEILEDPRIQPYFTTDAPELNALLDISKILASNKVLGKWVAKQMPALAMLEISAKQAYNATDWYLSFKRIAEANNINGQVMESARYLQGKIDETFVELRNCP